MRFAVVVPVGPDPSELERLRGLTDSLQANVGGTGTLVLIDDGEGPRELQSHIAWSPLETVILRAPPVTGNMSPNDRMAAATITYLRWLSESSCDYALKLDTDALVIGDFRPALERALGQSDVGVWGACDRNTVDGGTRDLTLWRNQLLLACSPVQVRRHGGGIRLAPAVSGRAGTTRRFLFRAVRSARRRGYRLGEHCLGGAYAVATTAARALATAGALDDAQITCGTGLGEDVVLGLLVRAAGFRLGTLVARGEPFAVRYRGLLATPEELVAAGHAVVHSVRSSDPEVERRTRQTFERLRRGPGS